MYAQEENQATKEILRVWPDYICLLVNIIWVWNDDDRGWYGKNGWDETGKEVNWRGCRKCNKQRQCWQAKTHKVSLCCNVWIWHKCQGLLDLWPHAIAAGGLQRLPQSNTFTGWRCLSILSFIWKRQQER